MKPLQDITVVELTTYWAATTTGRFLRSLGARVIRIETPPKGDACRYFGMAYHMPITAEENPIHDMYNGGKECLALDLTQPENREIVYNMLEKADVFLTSTREKGLKKLGLDWETIKEKFPHIVMAHATGWGKDGPMSGMPGMCLPVKEGGIGFDYRLSMGLPDYFIKTIREKQDGQWNMGRLYYELISRRPGEKNIAYCESHDQALVGDKTLMFRLADKEMYWGMNRGYENMVVERAVALHKMIRLVTIAAGGEGYLNFMGNEFGHPEWIDFPREGNDWSFAHARRLWSLAENGYLRYELLGNFDKAMIAMIKKYDVLEGGMPRCLRQHEDDQILAFEKKGCVFVFNFHPTRSQTGLFVPVPENGDYQVVLSTDDKVFGGYQNIDKTVIYHTWAHDPQMGDGFVIYLPARTAVVLRKVEKKKD